MSDKLYVFDKLNNRYEAMSKEQILAAIAQAVSTGEIKDIDTGFVTTINEQNKGEGLKFWIGTQAEYNAIAEKERNCFYIVTDDTFSDDIDKSLESLETSIETINETITNITGTPAWQYSYIRFEDGATGIGGIQYFKKNGVVHALGTMQFAYGVFETYGNTYYLDEMPIALHCEHGEIMYLSVPATYHDEALGGTYEGVGIVKIEKYDFGMKLTTEDYPFPDGVTQIDYHFNFMYIAV